MKKKRGIKKPLSWLLAGSVLIGAIPIGDVTVANAAELTTLEKNKMLGATAADWQSANIREWLNSDKFIVDYTALKPSYKDEEGFLSDKNFTQEERDGIAITRHGAGLQGSMWNINKTSYFSQKSVVHNDYIYNDKVFILHYNDLFNYIERNKELFNQNTKYYSDYLKTKTNKTGKYDYMVNSGYYNGGYTGVSVLYTSTFRQVNTRDQRNIVPALSLKPDYIFSNGKIAKDLIVGEFVKFGKYNGEEIEWQIINKTPDGYPLLWATRILTTKEYDAQGDINPNASQYINFPNYDVNISTGNGQAVSWETKQPIDSVPIIGFENESALTTPTNEQSFIMKIKVTDSKYPIRKITLPDGSVVSGATADWEITANGEYDIVAENSIGVISVRHVVTRAINTPATVNITTNKDEATKWSNKPITVNISASNNGVYTTTAKGGKNMGYSGSSASAYPSWMSLGGKKIHIKGTLRNVMSDEAASKVDMNAAIRLRLSMMGYTNSQMAYSWPIIRSIPLKTLKESGTIEIDEIYTIPSNAYGSVFGYLNLMDNNSAYMKAPYDYWMSDFTFELLDKDDLQIVEIIMPDGQVINADHATYTISENGSYTFAVKDNRGKTTSKTINLAVDIAPPVIQITNGETESGYVKNKIITVEATDSLSGVKSIKLPNGESRATTQEGQSLLVEYNITQNGNYTFEALDYAGNKSTKTITVSNIDNEAPTGIITADKTSWTNTDVNLSVQVADTASGVDYVLNPAGNKTTTYTAKTNGEYAFKLYDKIGNEKTVYYAVKNIDKTNPSLPSMQVLKNKLTIMGGTDSESGVKETLYRINNGEWMTYSGIVTLEDGNYTINAKTVDNSNNSSSEATINVVVYESALVKATESVVKAETSKKQTDVDSAMTLVNSLPNNLDKNSLISRLVVLQGYVDAVRIATEAVEKSESSNLQNDVDIASTFVAKIPEGTDRSNLSSRLNIVQSYINSVKTATAAVVKAESSKTQVDVNSAKTLVQGLKDGIDKTELSSRLDSVQDEINKTSAMNSAIEAVIKAENSKLQIDVDSAKILVVKLPEGTTKSNLSSRLESVQTYINAVSTATSAVVKAEGSKTQVDVNSAKVLVDSLPNGEHKTDLTNRLTVVQVAIDTTIATNAVVAAEAAKTQTAVDTAKTAIAKLPAGTDKTNLTNRINAVQAEVDATKALQTATSAVVKAEGSKSQVDVDSARILVNNLKNSTEKTALTSRLDVVQTHINSVNIATSAVVKAETSKAQVDIDKASELVGVLPSGIAKTDLSNRLTAVQVYIDTLAATEAVITAETTKLQSDIDAAKTAIAELPEGINKTSLTVRINNVQKYVDAVKTATIAVVKAEENKTQADVNSAKILVDSLPSGTDKINLTNRLVVVQIVIDTTVATNAVVVAETAKTQATVDTAKTAIAKLPDGTDKANLTNRINAVQAEVDEMKALQIATEVVIKAEISKSQTDVDFAKALVTKLTSSDKKVSLTNRLSIIQEYIDTLKSATEAVIKAENSLLQADVDLAKAAIAKLPAGVNKSSLETRINSVQAEVDIMRITQIAIDSVSKAENTITQEDVNFAKTLVLALPNGDNKQTLLKRLETVQTLIYKNESDALIEDINKEISVEIKDESKIDELESIIKDLEDMINKMPDSVEKTETEISVNITKANIIIIKAGNSLSNDDVESAKSVLSLLPDGPEKTSLIEKLKVVEEGINNAFNLEVERLAKEAEPKVVMAEQYKRTQYVDSAKIAVDLIPDSHRKTELMERLMKVLQDIDDNLNGGSDSPNSPEMVAEADRKLKIAERYRRDSYFTEAEEEIQKLSDSRDKTLLLDRLEALREMIIQESFEKALKIAENKVIMAERYQKDSYITMAREAVNLLPDYPEKEALESRLDNIGQIPGGETPGDGDQPVQSVSSERVVKAAIFAVERAESNPTRYNILYADRKIKLITNVTPEKETLVARVNKLKVENEKKVAEQNIEKNLVLAEKYVILAEKYKNEYYTKKAEIKVNALLDSEGKILLQNRIENLRQM